jgi:Bacterial SH3 domain
MNVARLAASAAMLISLTIDLAAAKPATVAAEVNLRKGPGTDSEIITLIPKGTMVEVGTCANGWCMVSFNGQDGYSIATNLGLAPPPVRRRPVGGYDYPPPPGTYGPPGYVAGPPVYYEYGPPVYYSPYYRPYYGFGWRGGGWRRHW